jgi:hypothetical protein
MYLSKPLSTERTNLELVDSYITFPTRLYTKV